MQDMTAKGRLILYLSAALAAGLAAASTLLLAPGIGPGPGDAADDAAMVGTVLPEPRPLPAVSLTDHHGAPWTPADDLTGRWQFVFFGFTHCPDVCPMTLATLAGTLERLDAATARPEVVFISVDPQRDTPAAMADYVSHFHDAFIGVSGERDQIDRLTEALGIAYTLHAPDENGDYAVDHSAAILLIDPQGRLRALWQPPHGRAVLAEEFQRIRARFGPT